MNWGLPTAAQSAPQDLKEWGNAAEWRAILWYQARPWGVDRSLIDDPDFFLSATGATDPVAELQALALALEQDNTISSKSVVCRFPRRTKWLARKWKRADLAAAVTSCPPGVIDPGEVDQIYIVFSSYFLESPASFFGHLFLRFSASSEKETYNPFLDPVLNFSAAHGDVGFLTYMAGGMLGWFPGIFEVLPMHFKIQQYNNFESRDLWEYRLNLSKDQIHSLVLSLQEVSPYYSDYYYLSRNCSLLLAKLISSVAPEMEIGAKFSIWSTPIAILKRTVERVGDSQQMTFRPSNRSRYLALYGALSAEQKVFFDSIVSAQNLDEVSFLSAQDEMAVLDAVLEFIDFDTRLAGPGDSETGSSPISSLRQKALMRRAKLPAGKALVFSPPPFDNPVLMRPEQSVSAGFTDQGGEQAALLQWQPTLKDLITVSPGFRPDIGMVMMRLQLFATADKLDLLRFDILDVENYQPNLPYKNFYNMNFRFSYGHLDSQWIHPKGGEADISTNQGVSLWGTTFYGELRTLAQITANRSFGSKLHLGPGLGVIREWSGIGLKFHALYNRDFTWSSGIPARNDSKLLMSQTIFPSLDLEASARLFDQTREYQLLLRGFF